MERVAGLLELPLQLGAGAARVLSRKTALTHKVGRISAYCRLARVIFTLLKRAYKVSSDWNKFHDEVERLAQLFNNNYSMKMIEGETKKFLDKRITEPEEEDDTVIHNLFQLNQMTSQYKQDEKVLKDIYKSKFKCNNENKVLSLTVYDKK